ncbi:MAG: oxidoreductase [Nitrosomonadales bacterium]|nr:oxidoreductase [Nitrosomonadales bacterium]
MSEQDIHDDIYAGLRQLADSAFPKRCKFCGREYLNSAEFLAATQPLRANASGLKQSRDDEGHAIVELFRNCVCGSTLLESYWNRRDLSEAGIMRRKRFQDMVGKLVATGCPAETARGELLKFMHGQPNDLMNLAKRHRTEEK